MVVDIVPHENVARSQASMTAAAIINAYQDYHVYATLAHSGRSIVKLSKHQNVGEVASAQIE